MDEDMPHMFSVRRARVAPLGFDLRGQILNARQFLPALTAVFAAVKMNRLDSHLDDLFICRIDSDRPDVAFKHSEPIFPGVVGAIEPVLCDAEIDDIGLASQSVDGVDRAALKGDRHFFPGTVLGTPDEQTFLGTCVDSYWTWHDEYSLPCKIVWRLCF